MQSLKTATEQAVILCCLIKDDVDIFEMDGDYKAVRASFSTKKEIERKVSYEKGTAIVRDAKGKKLEFFKPVQEEKAKPKASKEKPKSKEKEPESN